MINEYNRIKNILGIERAAIKLFIIRYGIYIDGDMLAKSISDYPSAYRTKRVKKHTALVDNKLIDINNEDVPFIPEEIFITYSNKRSVVKVNYNKDSIFKLIVEDNKLFIDSKELSIKLPCELSKKNNNGNKYVQVLGADRVAVLGFEGCSGWYNNTQCKFCDSCASRADDESVIPSLNILTTTFNGDIDKWLRSTEEKYFSQLHAAYKEIIHSNSVKPHFHLHVMSGNMFDTAKEWDYMLRLSEVFNKIEPLDNIDSYLNLLPPPNYDYLTKAKELGFKKLIFNMEVFGDDIYRTVCPEKYKKAPFNYFIDIMKQGVKIFGHGKIRCGFVLGAQPIKDLKEGCKILAEIGVVSDFTVFTPKKGTPWEKKKGPNIEETAEFVIFLASLYKKYNFEPLYCAQSSRSAVMNEMLE